MKVDYRFRDWCRKNNIEKVSMSAWRQWCDEEDGDFQGQTEQKM